MAQHLCRNSAPARRRDHTATDLTDAVLGKREHRLAEVAVGPIGDHQVEKRALEATYLIELHDALTVSRRKRRDPTGRRCFLLESTSESEVFGPERAQGKRVPFELPLREGDLRLHGFIVRIGSFSRSRDCDAFARQATEARGSSDQLISA